MPLKPVTREELEHLVLWCHNEVTTRHMKGVVVAVSGGADSATAVGLFVKALGSERVLGVNIPIESDDSAKTDAHVVCNHYGVKLLDRSLDLTFKTFMDEGFVKETAFYNGLSPKQFAIVKGNIKARLRTTLARAYAEMHGYLFINTCNWSETVIGYETKGGGDADGDLSPLRMFVKEDVWAMLRMLDAPACVIDKAPSAGLEEGQLDEVDMGLTYKTLDKLARLYVTGELDGMIDVPDVSTEDLARFHRMVNASAHKRDPMPYFVRFIESPMQTNGIQRDDEDND